MIGLRWAIDPSAAASELGMTLLVRRGTQLPDRRCRRSISFDGQHDLDRPEPRGNAAGFMRLH